MLKPAQNTIIPLSLASHSSKNTSKQQKEKKNNYPTNMENKVIKNFREDTQNRRKSTHNNCKQVKLIEKQIENIKPFFSKKAYKQQVKDTKFFSKPNHVDKNRSIRAQQPKQFLLPHSATNNVKRQSKSKTNNTSNMQVISFQNLRTNNLNSKANKTSSKSIGSLKNFSANTSIQKNRGYLNSGKFSYLQNKQINKNKLHKSIQNLRRPRDQYTIQIQIKERQQMQKRQNRYEVQLNQAEKIKKDTTIINNLEEQTQIMQRSDKNSPYKAFKLSSKNTSYDEGKSVLKRFNSDYKFKKYHYLDGFQQNTQYEDSFIGSKDFQKHCDNIMRNKLYLSPKSSSRKNLQCNNLSYQKYRSKKRSQKQQSPKQTILIKISESDAKFLNQYKQQIDNLKYHYYNDPTVVHKPNSDYSSKVNKSIQKYEALNSNKPNKNTAQPTKYQKRQQILNNQFNILKGGTNIVSKPNQCKMINSVKCLDNFQYHSTGKIYYLNQLNAQKSFQKGKNLPFYNQSENARKDIERQRKMLQAQRQRHKLQKQKDIQRSRQQLQRRSIDNHKELKILKQRQIQIQNQRNHRRLLQEQRKQKQKNMRIQRYTLQKQDKKRQNLNMNSRGQLDRYRVYNYLDQKHLRKDQYTTLQQNRSRSRSRQQLLRNQRSRHEGSRQNSYQKIMLGYNSIANTISQKDFSSKQRNYQSSKNIDIKQFILTDRKKQGSNLYAQKETCRCNHECQCNLANQLNTSRLHRLNTKLDSYIVKNLKNEPYHEVNRGDLKSNRNRNY